jgi:hypothetical protein
LADGDDGFFAKNPSQAVIMAKDPKDLILGKRSKYVFSNIKTTSAIRSWVNSNDPALQLKIYNKSMNVIHTACYTPAKFSNYAPSVFHSTSDQQYIMNGNEVEKGFIRLEYIEIRKIDLQNIEKMELSVIGKECWQIAQKQRF